MRIGIATTTRFHMADLTRELKRSGEHVTLFTALPRWKVDDELRSGAQTRSGRLILWRLASRFPYIRETNAWENNTFCDFGRWLRRAVLEARVNVVDALDGVGLEAGTAVQERGGIWMCNRGSTHILTQRALLRAEHQRWKQPIPASYFDPWMVNRCLAEYAAASAIVVPSQFVKRSFVEQGFDSSQVHVCPYGVDTALFHPEPRQDSRFRALFVGAHSIRKGIGYLFDAVRPLVKAGSLELWMVGSVTSDGRSILERNSDLFVAHGVQPRSRLSWYYSQASVLVMPSIEEGLALVQAQAMACGLPVIATVNTGAEDLFTDGVEGFIVPPRDPEAIRDRLQFLLDNPERLAAMKAAALERVRFLGGWARYAESCREVYRQVLAARGRAYSHPTG